MGHPAKRESVPVAERVLLTPDVAREYLATVVDHVNRRVSARKVDEYSKAILAGHWHETGDTIKFADDGQMIDGQHRCHAVILANTPIPIFRVDGLTRNSFVAIDTGKRRTFADVLDILGYKDTTNLAAAIRWAIGLESPDKYGKKRHSFSITLDNDALLDWFGANEEISKSLEIARTQRLLPASLCCALHFLFSQRDPAMAATWCNVVANGILDDNTPLSVEDPVYKLREQLIADAKLKALAASKMPNIQKAARAVKTWNAWRKGENIGLVRWIQNGPRPEPFPVIE